ncbi:hypothetical protein NEF87_002156 [Candidatus Lokiarchaeum ossiferum]|uniref:Uncharacterized protein n=1 Tax=Candidatus Lokiarchaeum ossiferum TaxID=2951803 RepID=A0ABY6HTJ1_9ARCH|nr:hypothetical protein NEF87_002156 [Candidatus Lokiarchaeum sp. B-35]
MNLENIILLEEKRTQILQKIKQIESIYKRISFFGNKNQLKSQFADFNLHVLFYISWKEKITYPKLLSHSDSRILNIAHQLDLNNKHLITQLTYFYQRSEGRFQNISEVTYFINFSESLLDFLKKSLHVEAKLFAPFQFISSLF